MKPIVVLAGNIKQYRDFLRLCNVDVHNPNYIYFSGQNQLLGYILDTIIIVGTFWDRPDANELYGHAKLRLSPEGKIYDETR